MIWSDDSKRICQDCHSLDLGRPMRHNEPVVPLYDIAASVALFISYVNGVTYNNAKELQHYDVRQCYMLTDTKVSHTMRIIQSRTVQALVLAEDNTPHDRYQSKLRATFWVGSLFQ